MSNPFKYFKDKKEIWADWKIPNGSGVVYELAMDIYNSRPHFTVSPELDAIWEHEKIVYEGKDFSTKDVAKNVYGCYSDIDDPTLDWSYYQRVTIAIPLPKDAETKWFTKGEQSRCEKETCIEKYFGVMPEDYNTKISVSFADLVDLLYSFEQQDIPAIPLPKERKIAIDPREYAKIAAKNEGVYTPKLKSAEQQDIPMDKEIRAAILGTLVIENKQSIDLAVKKILKIVSPSPKEEKES